MFCLIIFHFVCYFMVNFGRRLYEDDRFLHKKVIIRHHKQLSWFNEKFCIVGGSLRTLVFLMGSKVSRTRIFFTKINVSPKSSIRYYWLNLVSIVADNLLDTKRCIITIWELLSLSQMCRNINEIHTRFLIFLTNELFGYFRISWVFWKDCY